MRDTVHSRADRTPDERIHPEIDGNIDVSEMERSSADNSSSDTTADKRRSTPPPAPTHPPRRTADAGTDGHTLASQRTADTDPGATSLRPTISDEHRILEAIRPSDQRLTEESDMPDDEETRNPPNHTHDTSGPKIIISPEADIPETNSGTQIMTPRTGLFSHTTKTPEPSLSVQKLAETPTKQPWWKRTDTRLASAVLAGLAFLGVIDRQKTPSPADTSPEISAPTDAPGSPDWFTTATQTVPTAQKDAKSYHEYLSTTEAANRAAEAIRSVLDDMLDDYAQRPVAVAAKLAELLSPFMSAPAINQLTSDLEPNIRQFTDAVEAGQTGTAVRIRQDITRAVRDRVAASAPPSGADLVRRLQHGEHRPASPSSSDALNRAIGRIADNSSNNQTAHDVAHAINRGESLDTFAQPRTERSVRTPNTPPTASLPRNAMDMQRSDRAADYDATRDAERARIAEVRARIANDNATIRAEQAAASTGAAAELVGNNIANPPDIHATWDDVMSGRSSGTTRTQRDTIPLMTTRYIDLNTSHPSSVDTRASRVPNPYNPDDTEEMEGADAVEELTDADLIPVLPEVAPQITPPPIPKPTKPSRHMVESGKPTDADVANNSDDSDDTTPEAQTREITIGNQHITEGGKIEIANKNGDFIPYTVTGIVRGDGSPDRLLLISTDGRHIKTFKDIATLERNPKSFRVNT